MKLTTTIKRIKLHYHRLIDLNICHGIIKSLYDDKKEIDFLDMTAFGGFGESEENSKEINLLEILDRSGTANCMWALPCVDQERKIVNKMARSFAIQCAENVLHLFEEQYPDDDRPRLAIEMARDRFNNESYLSDYSDRKIADDLAEDAWKSSENCEKDFYIHHDKVMSIHDISYEDAKSTNNDIYNISETYLSAMFSAKAAGDIIRSYGCAINIIYACAVTVEDAFEALHNKIEEQEKLKEILRSLLQDD